MESQLIIQTPENVRIHYNLAGVGTRFFALAVDTVIQGALLTLFSWPLIHWRVVNFNELPEKMGLLNGVLLAVVILFIMLITFGYFIFFETLWDGQTPGKKIFGLKVRRLGGQPVGFLAALIRNLLRIVDFLPWAYIGGFITMFFNSMGRRIGDLAAGTMVIRERRKRSPVPISLTPEDNEDEIRSWLGGVLPSLTERELGPIREYLRRGNRFSPVQRQQLADSILKRVLICFHPAEALPPTSSEQVLRVIYRWYQTVHYSWLEKSRETDTALETPTGSFSKD